MKTAYTPTQTTQPGVSTAAEPAFTLDEQTHVATTEITQVLSGFLGDGQSQFAMHAAINDETVMMAALDVLSRRTLSVLDSLSDDALVALGSGRISWQMMCRAAALRWDQAHSTPPAN